MMKLLLGTTAALALMAGEALAQAQTSPDAAASEPPTASDSATPGGDADKMSAPASSSTTEIQTNPPSDSADVEEAAQSASSAAPLTQALPDVAQESPPPVESFVSGQEEGELTASDLIGQTIHDAEGASLGTISDLVIDKDRTLSLVVVDVGEASAKRSVAFSIESLGYRMGKNAIELVASIDRATLEDAPEFVSLADEMSQNDAQSLTEDDAETVPAEGPTPGAGDSSSNGSSPAN